MLSHTCSDFTIIIFRYSDSIVMRLSGKRFPAMQSSGCRCAAVVDLGLGELDLENLKNLKHLVKGVCFGS